MSDQLPPQPGYVHGTSQISDDLARMVADSGITYQRAVEPTSALTLTPVPLDADATRELSRAAKQATSWTERRNALIREAHAAGGGIREIARATGLNPATIHNIIKPRGRA